MLVLKSMSDPDKKSVSFVFHPQKIPQSAGCYLFYDEKETLLYVGKAKNLRKRVSQYFQKNSHPPKTQVMIQKIQKIETRATSSEIEALILENNLIKKFHPRYNIRLKDDKNFVYLHLTKEEKPKMEVVRKIKRDGSYYLGPKTATKEFRKLLRFCQKFFHIRMVNPAQDYYPDVIAGKYELPDEQYNENVERMKKFLNGQTQDVKKSLQEKMMQFAQEKNFEAAAKIRDTLQAIDISTKKQRVSFTDGLDRDFISFVRDEKNAYVVRLSFRSGQLLDQNEIVLSAQDFFEAHEILEAFLLQFYPTIDRLPHEIYVPHPLPHTSDIQDFLTSHIPSSHQVKITVPQKGEKKQALQIAFQNAQHFQHQKDLEALSHAENFAQALPQLAEALDLSVPPARIEGYDISHFGGENTVASQVVFVDGVPQKGQYRRYKLKNLSPGKIDDFASMYEILSRRFARKDDKKFAEKFPDLIVIDGGKGQLSSVMKAVKDFEENDLFPDGFDPQTQIIALAKKEETLFRPGESQGLLLPLESSALKLLQRIRDESHRFAITFQRSLRQKNTVKSVLDEIPGIGKTTKQKLLQRFGSVGEIKKASDKQLREVLSEKQFESLKKNL